MAGLRQKTITGVAWNLAEQFAVRGISVFVTLILTYFLSPEDFGLVAMMAVFISIATSLMDSGFRQALIRIPDATQIDFNTAFYANIVLGIISYSLLFLAAPLIAGFYDEVRLVALIRVAGLLVIINAFQVVQFACLGRALNFKAQFQSALPAAVISAFVAVILAYFGFGVWALVAQMVVSACLVSFLLWAQNIWRPSLEWSINSLKSMYRFGYKLFLSGLLDTCFRNMHVIVIAKLFSSGLAGLYFFADRVRELIIFQMVTAIQNVTYPALSTLQREPVRLKNGYKKVIALSAFTLFPLILFIAALAETIFQVLLPEKWWPATVYFQLMCLAGVLVPIHAINLNILQVMGRSDLFLWLEIIKKLIALITLVITYRYGIIAMLMGQIFSSLLAYLPNSFYSKQLIDYNVYEQLTDFVPYLFLASFVGVLLLWAQTIISCSEVIEIFVLGASAVISYLFCAWVLRLHALELAFDLIRGRVWMKDV